MCTCPEISFRQHKSFGCRDFFCQLTKSNYQYIGTVSISSLIYWWDIDKLITGHCRVNFLWQVFLTMFNYRQILGRFKLQSGDLFPLARADPTSAVNFIFLRETCPLIKEMLKLRRFGWKICIVYDTGNIFGVLNSLLYGFNGYLRCFSIKHDHVLCYILRVLEIFGEKIKL